MARTSPADERDLSFMRRALRLAERGRGTTKPNPMVGAVVVRGDRVLAEGYHVRAGGDHAEVAALRKLGFRAPGATLYVTLEPCCHHGRTGPCTEVVLSAGIRRVVVAARDPNPLVDGRGITRLRRAGVRVDVGLLSDEAERLNRAFATWIAHERPLVTLKAAATLDGAIAERTEGPPRGRITWITGEAARREAHRLRAGHDAILVGSGTVLADDPRLDVRLPGVTAAPLRVVLDGRLRTPPNARFLRLPGPPPLVIASEPRDASRRTRSERLARARRLAHEGAEVLLFSARGDRPPLGRVLRELADRDVQSLLVEGGSTVHGAFVAAGLVDRVAFFFAPLLTGGGVPLASGADLPIARALRLGPPTARLVGGDILLESDVVATKIPSRSR